MDRVVVHRHGEPPDSTDFQRKLDDWNSALTGPHKIVLQWNSRVRLRRKDPDIWSGRWELWVTMEDSSHPLSKYLRRAGDRHLPDKGWCRFLQTWQYDDGTFAPLDDRLFGQLRRQDTWRNRRWYQEVIEETEERTDNEWRGKIRDAVQDAENYYRNWDNPFFSPGSSGGDWRWRNR